MSAVAALMGKLNESKDKIMHSFIHWHFAIKKDAQQKERFAMRPGSGNNALAFLACIKCDLIGSA